MAPKRPSPSDQPPPSVEEEESSSSGEESSSSEEIQPKPTVQIPTPDEKEEESSGEEEESDESGSDSPLVQPPIPSKPISSKPMVETPKSNKSISAAAAGGKRRLEPDSNDNKDSKRDIKKKKKISEDEIEKKPLIERVFSEKDEIELLKGLIEFKKKGNQISNNMSDKFLEFVKGSLQFKATLSQLNNKVRRLQQKYTKNVKRAKPGSDPKITKPHELKSYNLSKEIWGDQVLKDDVLEDNQSGIPPMGGPNYPFLDQSLNPPNHLSLPVPPACLGGHTANHTWDMYGSSKAQAFDRRWKALMFKETEVYLERVTLVQEQTKWMLDLHKSSDS